MNRIALLVALLLATSAQAAGPSLTDSGSVEAAIQARESRITVVSTELDSTQGELTDIKSQLQWAWSRARGVREQLDELRDTGHLSTAAGQVQYEMLQAGLQQCKDEIVSLQWDRSLTRDKRQALRGERRDLGREIAALNRSKSDRSGSSYIARGAGKAEAERPNATPDR